MKTSWLLSSLQIDAAGGSLHRVLQSIADGFQAEEVRLRKMRADLDPAHEALLTNQWNTLTHGLFGAAFVTCQAYINAVAASAQEFRRHIVSDLKRSSESLPKTRPELLDLLGSPSQIRLIDALANYFKHSEEWAKDEWQNPSGHSKTTIKTLKGWGFTRSETNLLAQGAEKLHVVRGQDVTSLDAIFDEWSRNVVGAARLDAGLPERHSTKPPR